MALALARFCAHLREDWVLVWQLQNSLDLPVPSPAVAKTVWAAQCLALRLQKLPGPRTCVKGDGELEKLAVEMVKVRAKTS